MSDHANLSERYALLERLAPGGAEDFITEVFCWILQQEDVGKAFLEFLQKRKWENKAAHNEIISGIQREEYTWSTQESYRISNGVKRPDMICECESESGKQALIFEHKVRTKLHADQLKNYREIGKEKYGNDKSAIVLITAQNYQKEQNPDLHFLWRHVYDWLDTWLNEWLRDRASGPDDANLEFVCRNFLTLLKQRGLGPMSSITDEHFKAFKSVHLAEEGREMIKGLLNRVKDFSWETELSTLKERKQDIVDTRSAKVKDRYGRIEFNLLHGWNPGMIVCVLHGWGYGWYPDGPYACVMLGIDEASQGTYYKKHHDELFKSLKKEEKNLKKEWEICDEGKESKWHPIKIRRKLKDILLPELSGEQQADALLEEMKRAVELIVNQDMFWEMREDMKRAADRGVS